jgi:hypothetical protein
MPSFRTVDNPVGCRIRADIVSRMRWDSLFDDLESQLERERTAEELDIEAEEERLRLGRLSMRDRLFALTLAPGNRTIRIGLTGGIRLAVRPQSLGRDWLSAVLADGRQCIVPLAAIATVSLGRAEVSASLAAMTQDTVSGRLGLPFVLRDLCRRRRQVELTTLDGVLVGTIDRVGRDHLDLAVHDAGTARRESDVRDVLMLPIGRIVIVRA